MVPVLCVFCLRPVYTEKNYLDGPDQNIIIQETNVLGGFQCIDSALPSPVLCNVAGVVKLDGFCSI